MTQFILEFVHPSLGRQAWLYETPEAADTVRRLLKNRWRESHPVVKLYQGEPQQ